MEVEGRGGGRRGEVVGEREMSIEVEGEGVWGVGEGVWGMGVEGEGV